MKDIDLILYIIAFLFTLTLTVLCSRLLIPLLKKRAEQPIYEDGPSWHMSKSGTPTMGGLSFLISITLTLILCSIYRYLADDVAGAISLLLCCSYSLINSSIGILDDATKLKRKQNAGLTPRAKLILQFASAALFLLSRRLLIGDNTAVTFSFATIDVGILYYLVSAIILVGITNCANLTDGIDGLATSVAFAIGVSYFYFSYARINTMSLASATLIGATIGFLFFNVHPAKVFMGDTGSLFLGSLVAALAFDADNPLLAVMSGGVYVIEGISVIAQVVYFKLCKKRLFKMAPIHHHLEKCGWDENKICLCAIILTLLFAIPTSMVFIP